MTKFVDCQKMHELHPETFDELNDIELNDIKSGDFVKVSCDGERFWVIVDEVKDDKITGSVNNNLLFENTFKYQESIEFEKKNVFEIIKRSTFFGDLLLRGSK